MAQSNVDRQRVIHGPATENVCLANSVRMHGRTAAEHIGLVGITTVSMSWRYGGVDTPCGTIWASARWDL